MVFKGPRMEWHRPTSLSHLLELRQKHPGAKVLSSLFFWACFGFAQSFCFFLLSCTVFLLIFYICVYKVVVGNTELGVEVKFKHCDYPVYICPSGVKEMSEIIVTQAGVRFEKVIFQ